MFLRCGNLNKIVALATLSFCKHLIISIYWFKSVATELQEQYIRTGTGRIGNIHELRNVTERLLILGGNTITKGNVMAYATPQVD